jgi:hypothetical protein
MERNELKDFQERRAAAHRAEQIPLIKARQEAGFKMSSLVADPNWEFYGRYIEAEKALAEARCKAAEQAILNLANPLSPQDELKAKLSLANHQGAREAFHYALNVAKVLITEGEEAAKAVEGSIEKA